MHQQQNEAVTISFKDGRSLSVDAGNIRSINPIQDLLVISLKDGRNATIPSNDIRSITTYQPNQLTQLQQCQPAPYTVRHHPSEFNQQYGGISRWVMMIGLGIVGAFLFAGGLKFLATPVVVNPPAQPAPIYNPNCWIGCSGG